MNISYYTIWAGLNPAVGFGYAGQHIVKSLQGLGHNVSYANPKADVQINFTQPHLFKLHRGQYQIGYTPWESTAMRKDWVERFNQCDEVWTPSDWCAEVFKENGVTKPIYVYPHGIEEKWSAVKRSYNENEIFKFLHMGEPSPRKSGQLVVDTFIKMFGNNPKYQLTLKCHNTHTVRVYDKNGELRLPEDVYSNIKVIKDEMSIDDLVALHQRHHVLIYPTWGEGFGFIPLQALATGMPVITTYPWAHYKKFLGPLKLRSTLTAETLPKAVGDEHVGKMFKPDEKHLEELMYDSVLNFKAYSGYYFAQSTKIHEEYNWIQLTNKAFDHISKKFQ